MKTGYAHTFSTPNCVLRPGGSITVPWPVDKQIDQHGPYNAESFPDKRVRIAVRYLRRRFQVRSVSFFDSSRREYRLRREGAVERNLTVDPFHACSLRAGAALLPCPPLAAGCADHSGCDDLRQSLSCGMFVAAV